MLAGAEYHRMDEVERALLVAKAMFIFGVAMMVLAATGELLGWWNELGEFLGLAGIIATGLALSIALLVGATRRQVVRVETRVGEGNGLLGLLNRKHDETNAKMDAALARHDETNAKMDESKSALDRQTRVLEDIRDLLRGRDREPA